MKSVLFAALLFPVCCFSQKYFPKVQVGGGYAFYTGSATDGNINGDYAKNSLKSGFMGEVTVSQQLNGYLHVGLGGSVLKFDHTNAYVPVYAEVKVIGAGRYKLYSFLRPGYGIYKGSYPTASVDPGFGPQPTATQKGGFYIGYGVGVVLNVFYIQAAYHWLRFNTDSPNQDQISSSKGYGIAALTVGVRLP